MVCLGLNWFMAVCRKLQIKTVPLFGCFGTLYHLLEQKDCRVWGVADLQWCSVPISYSGRVYVLDGGQHGTGIFNCKTGSAPLEVIELPGRSAWPFWYWETVELDGFHRRHYVVWDIVLVLSFKSTVNFYVCLAPSCPDLARGLVLQPPDCNLTHYHPE